MALAEDIWKEVLVNGELKPLLRGLFDALPDDRERLDSDPEVLSEPERLPRDLRQAAERFLAEWLFFRHCRGLSPLPGAERFFPVRPFGGETPALEELLCKPAAMAVFPLKGDDRPAAARLFLQAGDAGPDNRDKFPARTNEWDGFRMYCNADKFDGPSWQLAADLARRALEENDRNALANLARKWIVSGKVTDSRVDRIELGNKLELRTPRSWMLPNDNRTSDHPEIHWVSTTKKAWRLICGSEVVEDEIDPLPDAYSLHCLVGGARNPILSVFFQLFPKRLHLYCSEETRAVGDNIRALLAEIVPGIAVIIENVPSDSMADLQALFTRRLSEDVRFGNVFVNATGGNRLMGFAMMLALYRQQSPKIQLVYRDVNAKHFEMQIIESKSDIYRNGSCRINRCPKELSKRLNWDFFWSKDPQRPITREDILQQ